MSIQILPSLLAADMGNLESEARRAGTTGGDALHLDIMDGVFVPNLSMGPAIVAMANRSTTLPLNVHLMLVHPDRYVTPFAEAGADSLLIHIESSCDVPATLKAIRAAGMHPGITLNPATPAERIFDLLPLVDEVLCMTVNPGYGGQSFMTEVLPKVSAVRDEARRQGRGDDLVLMVDGGIDQDSAPRCAAHGANAFVAGTSLFPHANMAERIRDMRAACTAACR